MDVAIHLSTAQADVGRRARLGRRAQRLAAASVGYNVLEAVVAISAGAAASSAALVGFGLDSLIEVGSGVIILWQFRHPVPESRERRALRLIAVSFFAMAGYVAVESLNSLIVHDQAAPSPVGIVLAVVSLVVMPTLSRAQRRTGRELASESVVADSKQTLMCTYLSAVLLVGLVANALLGWWWADPAAGLIVAVIALREGRGAWRGENCCASVPGGEGGCEDDCCRPDGVAGREVRDER